MVCNTLGKFLENQRIGAFLKLKNNELKLSGIAEAKPSGTEIPSQKLLEIWCRLFSRHSGKMLFYLPLCIFRHANRSHRLIVLKAPIMTEQNSFSIFC